MPAKKIKSGSSAKKDLNSKMIQTAESVKNLSKSKVKTNLIKTNTYSNSDASRTADANLKKIQPSGKREGSFFEMVYEVARQIPYGRVTSYGAIAACLGTKLSARMVGWAMNGADKIN